MKIVIAGGHGKIGTILGRRLAARGDTAVGLIRSAGQQDDLRAAGIEPAVLDLESAGPDDVVAVLQGADAVVFAAGAGPGSGAGRKDTVDRAAAVLLAEAAERAGVRRFVQISAMGVDLVADGAEPDGIDDVFLAYLRAKLAAEQDLTGRDLDWTILRPGGLTDDPPTGAVQLAASVPSGQVTRADVADVVVQLLDRPGTAGVTVELIGGETPVGQAVAALAP